MEPVPVNPPTPAPPPVLPPKKKTWWQKLLAPFAAAGAMLLKLLSQFKLVLFAILKFGWPILKTGGTMLISVWVYAHIWGWWFAVGFVLLIFVHECGHLLVAKIFGLRVSAPMFIPFMGAVILLKEAPRNAWVEACVGIGGPVLGSVGALVCAAIYLLTGNPMYCALAYTGFFLNLFNLAPVSPLDGGRIVTALSPWLWVVGYVVMGAYAIYHPTFILFLIMLMGLPRLFSLFRAKSAAQRRYFEVTTPQRFIMAGMYFGLIVLLGFGMELTFIPHN
jgi:Zn-dependent protease